MKYVEGDNLFNLTNQELLNYKKELLKRKLELLNEASRWESNFKEVDLVLRERIDSLELDLMEAEEARLSEEHYKNILQ